MERVYAMDGSWEEVPGPEDLPKFIFAADVGAKFDDTFLSRFVLGPTGEITLLPEDIAEGYVTIDSQGRAHPGWRSKAESLRDRAERELNQQITEDLVRAQQLERHREKVRNYRRKLNQFREWAMVYIEDVPADWPWEPLDLWRAPIGRLDDNVFTILFADPEPPLADVPVMLRPSGRNDGYFEALLPRQIANSPIQPIELIRDLDLEIVDYWDGEEWVEVPGNSRQIIVPRTLPT